MFVRLGLVPEQLKQSSTKGPDPQRMQNSFDLARPASKPVPKEGGQERRHQQANGSSKCGLRMRSRGHGDIKVLRDDKGRLRKQNAFRRHRQQQHLAPSTASSNVTGSGLQRASSNLNGRWRAHAASILIHFAGLDGDTVAHGKQGSMGLCRCTLAPSQMKPVLKVWFSLR